MEDYRVENEDKSEHEQKENNQVINEKPPTAAGKPKKKVKKVNLKVTENAANGDQGSNFVFYIYSHSSQIFSHRRKLTQTQQESKAEQVSKLQFLNYKIDHYTGTNWDGTLR